MPHFYKLFLELLSERFFFRRKRFLQRSRLKVLTLRLKLFQHTDLRVRGRIILFRHRLRVQRLWRPGNNRCRSTRSSSRWSRGRARRRWHRNCFWHATEATNTSRCSVIDCRRHSHLRQRILATEVENVGCGEHCSTFLSFLGSKLLLLHLE